jgi:hypothetical protein
LKNPSVVEREEVPGVGVARELAVAVEAAEVEAEQDLADPVALLLRAVLHELEAGAGHVLADHHPLGREARHHVGHVDEGVAPEDARQCALVLGLELVVELLVDPVAHLLGHRLHVELGGEPPDEPHQQPEVLQIRAHGGGDARVLDLDRDVAAVGERRAVDLADRRGGDRVLVE